MYKSCNQRINQRRTIAACVISLPLSIGVCFGINKGLEYIDYLKNFEDNSPAIIENSGTDLFEENGYGMRGPDGFYRKLKNLEQDRNRK